VNTDENYGERKCDDDVVVFEGYELTGKFFFIAFHNFKLFEGLCGGFGRHDMWICDLFFFLL
jgi:hypothetical protein